MNRVERKCENEPTVVFGFVLGGKFTLSLSEVRQCERFKVMSSIIIIMIASFWLKSNLANSNESL